MAVLKNPPAYGERNVRIVGLGTGETPPGPWATPVVTDPISRARKGEGSRVGESEGLIVPMMARTTQPCWRKGALLCQRAQRR